MLAYKQLTKQFFSNRIFIVLLTVLCILTSASFFFVRFTIDGNINRVNEIAAMGGDEARYRAALASNTTLAYTFLAATILLTAFVFFIFYYRFFRTNRKQIGCLKALGFQDRALSRYFILFTAELTLFGSLVGLLTAYPLSDTLLQANIDAYGIMGLVRSLSTASILICFVSAMVIFSLTSFISYRLFMGGKEPGDLIAGNLNKTNYAGALKAADKIANILPIKNKFSARIMLRKPLTILLVFIAVLFFNTFMIMAYSLNISSGKILDSQTIGHNYEYITSYDEYLPVSAEEDTLALLNTPGIVQYNGSVIEQNIAGLYLLNNFYEMQDTKGNLLPVPDSGMALIGEGLREVYGIRIGDMISLRISEKTMTVRVLAIAENTKSDTIYVNGSVLAALMGLEDGSYNILLSDKLPIAVGNTLSSSERIDLLEQDAVSNRVSGVINQAVGAVVGCILLFLALYMSFQDNTRDMLILSLIGFQPKAVRKMFIDIYQPLVWIFFGLSLPLSILLVKSIQRNLSITTGDYMPFGTNLIILCIIFAVLTLIYHIVQWGFGRMLQQIARKEETAEFTSVE